MVELFTKVHKRTWQVLLTLALCLCLLACQSGRPGAVKLSHDDVVFKGIVTRIDWLLGPGDTENAEADWYLTEFHVLQNIQGANSTVTIRTPIDAYDRCAVDFIEGEPWLVFARQTGAANGALWADPCGPSVSMFEFADDELSWRQKRGSAMLEKLPPLPATDALKLVHFWDHVHAYNGYTGTYTRKTCAEEGDVSVQVNLSPESLQALADVLQEIDFWRVPVEFLLDYSGQDTIILKSPCDYQVLWAQSGDQYHWLVWRCYNFPDRSQSLGHRLLDFSELLEDSLAAAGAFVDLPESECRFY